MRFVLTSVLLLCVAVATRGEVIADTTAFKKDADIKAGIGAVLFLAPAIVLSFMRNAEPAVENGEIK